MIRKFLIGVEGWMDDESMILSIGKFLVVFFIGMMLILFPIFLLTNQPPSDETKCLEAGNAWMITGHHQETHLVPMGKALMPQTRTVTDYGCIEIQR